MADRYLGDVPGIDELVPSSALLPSDYSVYEVNGLGELTADAGALGDLAYGVGYDDPFAYDVGAMDQPGPAEGGPRPVHNPMQSSYLPTYDDASGSSYSGPVKATDGTEFTQEQIDNAAAIAEVGAEVGATDRDIQVALMAAMVESNLRTLDYGDRDSIGMFQQRDAWGSREDRLDPHKSARMFFLGGAAGQQGLLDIKDRDSRPMGDLAQDVQVSAYPDRYAQRQADAVLLFDSLSGPGQTTRGQSGNDPYGLTERDGETIDNMTVAALDAATKEFGSGLRIMQGSHSHDVAASGGTHGGGGVLDLDVPNGDWVGAMTALRKIGFAAWVRNVPGYGQAGSGAHIHAVLIGNEQLSSEALTQVQSYLNNDDGLVGSRPDDGPREFVNNRFVWGEAPNRRDRRRGADAWRQQIIREAHTYLGTPFKWGGKDYTGVDTAGFIRGVYKRLGVDLPETTDGIAFASAHVPVEDTKPGDLIAWGWNPRLGVENIGIYLGNNQIIEAGAPGRVVQLSEIGTAALSSAWGIQMQDLIQQRQPSRPAARPASPTPSYATSTYVAPPTSSSGAPLQGQASSPYNDQGPSKPKRHGYGHGGTTWEQKPHSPLPGQP